MSTLDNEAIILLQEFERMAKAIAPPEKLELLAAWFDNYDQQSLPPDQAKKDHSMVQEDLRKWAQAHRNLFECAKELAKLAKILSR